MVDTRAVDGGGGGICGRRRVRGVAVVGNDMSQGDRYVAAPATGLASWSNEGWSSARPSEQVVESDPTPIKTGLLNAEGVPLYRVPNRGPLGFCR